MNSTYVLITPVKNEEANLPGLIESIVNQNIKPIAWVIADGSNDQSRKIITQAASEYAWIDLVKLDVDIAYSIGDHYASACIAGFGQALAYCEQNSVKFDYIALSDADMVYPEDYFGRCIDFLHNNSQFGIVSGKILVKDKEGKVYDERGMRLGDGQPRGTGRVWRKEAFVDTGGYILSKAPHTISDTKALLRGWKIKQLSDVICYQTRPTGGKLGLWTGYFRRGELFYYLNMPPLVILNGFISIMVISRPRNSTIKSFALLSGYCKAFFRREERCQDDEVRAYFGSYKRVIKNYWLFLRQLIKKEKLH